MGPLNTYKAKLTDILGSMYILDDQEVGDVGWHVQPCWFECADWWLVKFPNCHECLPEASGLGNLTTFTLTKAFNHFVCISYYLQGAKISNLFLDPSGHHLLISLKSSETEAGPSLYYLHTKWQQPRLVEDDENNYYDDGDEQDNDDEHDCYYMMVCWSISLLPSSHQEASTMNVL